MEDVQIEAAEFDDNLDANEPLAAHVEALLEGGGKVRVVASGITDSR